MTIDWARVPVIPKFFTAKHIKNLWFRPRRFFSARGYHEGDVDNAMDAVEYTLLAYERFTDAMREIGSRRSLNGPAMSIDINKALSQLEIAKKGKP